MTCMKDLSGRFAWVVWFRGFSNLSCFVVLNPARSSDHAMHIRSGVGSLACYLSEMDV
jgi:hypothetical protein